jgi:hypothetical protein
VPAHILVHILFGEGAALAQKVRGSWRRVAKCMNVPPLRPTHTACMTRRPEPDAHASRFHLVAAIITDAQDEVDGLFLFNGAQQKLHGNALVDGLGPHLHPYTPTPTSTSTYAHKNIPPLRVSHLCTRTSGRTFESRNCIQTSTRHCPGMMSTSSVSRISSRWSVSSRACIAPQSWSQSA